MLVAMADKRGRELGGIDCHLATQLDLVHVHCGLDVGLPYVEAVLDRVEVRRVAREQMELVRRMDGLEHSVDISRVLVRVIGDEILLGFRDEMQKECDEFDEPADCDSLTFLLVCQLLSDAPCKQTIARGDGGKDAERSSDEYCLV
jgi:hypothetical protein